MNDTMADARAGRGVTLFLAIAFGWSWAWGGVIWLTDAMRDPALFQGLAFLFMFGPALGALACAWRHDRGRRRDALGLRFPFRRGGAWLWLFVAWAIPVVFILAAVAFDIVLGPASPGAPGAALLAQAQVQAQAQGIDPAVLPPPAILAAVTIAGALTLGAGINMIGTLTEEFGWRGWLWDRWRPLGFWRGNLLIGLVWGVWHAPIIAQGYNYPGMPLWGPALMILFCVALGPLIGLVRERGGSILHAGLFHGTLNAFTAIGLMLSSDPDFPWLGPLGIGGLIAAALGWALVLLFLRGARQGAADGS